MADIRVPKLNNNDTEYLIVEWLVGDGKPVSAGEPVAVLETSKAADELEAEETGYLHHVAALNTWIAPGALLARVTAEAAPSPLPSPLPAPAPASVPSPLPAPAPASPTASVSSPDPALAGPPALAEDPASTALPVPAAPADPGLAPEAGQPVVTDPARAAMEDLGVSHAEVTALGLAVVRRADVVALAARRTANTATGEQGAGTHRLSRVQRAVARAVTTSHGTIPAAYTAVKFEVGPLLARAGELSRQVRRPVGLAELFVRAVAALHPAFPLFFAAVDGTEARLAEAPRVGVTLDLGEGLYVPVVRDTGSLRDIADTLMRHRLAAAEGAFREKDLTGANIVVTLHTDADVVLAIPFVFPGTVCALAITSPQPELALGEDGAVTTRTVATIGLAYDHRLVNGRDAALFLKALREELR
ncbi:hypothetical protein GCM10010517_11700 [Streptosporangium fragile]|uniref:Dihydrolipoamide acetyltransferase component of pyruvate dehydrogenase complex n=1 Tax=Streptosporangium fragile TaxID=46186 RepID=A0ABN3VSP6_9ACTN